ncbi:hypothetical protein [Halalkalibacillus halophilus]|uniref:hypothetical protein n=1 Tax=Halalkalibacillus halophilus TaxID=392827 RepID=UPI000486D411|nr:hypothetical protein [Halalkalibacillus halophilus]
MKKFCILLLSIGLITACYYYIPTDLDYEMYEEEAIVTQLPSSKLPDRTPKMTVSKENFGSSETQSHSVEHTNGSPQFLPSEEDERAVEKVNESFVFLEEEILRDLELIKSNFQEEYEPDMNILSQGALWMKYEREFKELEENADEKFNQVILNDLTKIEDPYLKEKQKEKMNQLFQEKKKEIENLITEQVNTWLDDEEV